MNTPSAVPRFSLRTPFPRVPRQPREENLVLPEECPQPVRTKDGEVVVDLGNPVLLLHPGILAFPAPGVEIGQGRSAYVKRSVNYLDGWAQPELRVTTSEEQYVRELRPLMALYGKECGLSIHIREGRGTNPPRIEVARNGRRVPLEKQEEAFHQLFEAEYLAKLPSTLRSDNRMSPLEGRVQGTLPGRRFSGALHLGEMPSEPGYYRFDIEELLRGLERVDKFPADSFSRFRPSMQWWDWQRREFTYERSRYVIEMKFADYPDTHHRAGSTRYYEKSTNGTAVPAVLMTVRCEDPRVPDYTVRKVFKQAGHALTRRAFEGQLNQLG